MNPLFSQQGYVVDFEKMTQTNVATNYERPVRRTMKIYDFDYVVWVLSAWSCFEVMRGYIVEKGEEEGREEIKKIFEELQQTCSRHNFYLNDEK